MGHPNTKFDFVDKSDIPSLPSSGVNRPVILYGITSDKGPEDLRLISASQFQRLYGAISFAKHGQPMLQAARSLAAGADLLIKRLVASDSKLANVVVVAKVKTTPVQKRTPAGELVYKTPGDTESLEPTGNTAVMVDAVTIKYSTQTITNATTIADVKTGAASLFSETADGDGYKSYPLFAIVDIGRGVSSKKFRIAPDYDSSKRLDFVQYVLSVVDGTTAMENLLFCYDQERIHGGVNYGLESVVRTNSDQISARWFDTYAEKFLELVATTIQDTVENLKLQDVLFGKTKSGSSNYRIAIAGDSVNLSSAAGIGLASGDNGSFGVAPITSESYAEQLEAFFNGSLDDNIYDVDKFKVTAIIDANYPIAVKIAAANLANFREDCMFLSDLGFVNTAEGMKTTIANLPASKVVYANHLSYDVIDPYSYKQIKVTCGYSHAKLFVEHVMNGANRPYAGQLYNVVLADAIEGTVNYLPKVTPVINQKEILGDARINYASYQGDLLVLETQFTTYPKHTQFSYMNNILAIQEVVRAVRTRCPKIRYSFIDGEDLETYKRDVQAVLDEYTGNFLDLKFEYIQDPLYVQNKIFRAAISVRFRNYVESEYFTIYALS